MWSFGIQNILFHILKIKFKFYEAIVVCTKQKSCTELMKMNIT